MNHAGGKYFVKPAIPQGNGGQPSILQVYNEYGYDLIFTVHPLPEMYFSTIYNQFTVPYNYTFLIRASFYNPASHVVSVRLFDEDNNLIMEEVSNPSTGNAEAGFYFTPSAYPTPLFYIVISFI